MTLAHCWHKRMAAGHISQKEHVNISTHITFIKTDNSATRERISSVIKNVIRKKLAADKIWDMKSSAWLTQTSFHKSSIWENVVCRSRNALQDSSLYLVTVAANLRGIFVVSPQPFDLNKCEEHFWFFFFLLLLLWEEALFLPLLSVCASNALPKWPKWLIIWDCNRRETMSMSATIVRLSSVLCLTEASHTQLAAVSAIGKCIGVWIGPTECLITVCKRRNGTRKK